jgi:hypothetical protein
VIRTRARYATAGRLFANRPVRRGAPSNSEIGTPGAFTPDKGDGYRLWNLAPLLPPGVRFSRMYRRRRELIDHVLVSHALLDRVEEVHTPRRIADRRDRSP